MLDSNDTTFIHNAFTILDSIHNADNKYFELSQCVQYLMCNYFER